MSKVKLVTLLTVATVTASAVTKRLVHKRRRLSQMNEVYDFINGIEKDYNARSDDQKYAHLIPQWRKIVHEQRRIIEGISSLFISDTDAQKIMRKARESLYPIASRMYL